MKKTACAICALLATSAMIAPTASAEIVHETNFASVADLVSISRIIAEDPSARLPNVRMDANLDCIVSIDDINIYRRHMQLYPLIDAINADIEQEWVEISDLFRMEHDGESVEIVLTVSSGMGYGTALTAEPYFNAWAYTGDYAAGDIVLIMECESDYMEYCAGNAAQYGEVFE